MKIIFATGFGDKSHLNQRQYRRRAEQTIVVKKFLELTANSFVRTVGNISTRKLNKEAIPDRTIDSLTLFAIMVSGSFTGSKGIYRGHVFPLSMTSSVVLHVGPNKNKYVWCCH